MLLRAFLLCTHLDTSLRTLSAVEHCVQVHSVHALDILTARQTDTAAQAGYPTFFHVFTAQVIFNMSFLVRSNIIFKGLEEGW